MSGFSSLILQEAKIFWLERYNVETNWYALWFPLVLWVGCWLYAKKSKIDYSEWVPLHLLHHIVAIALSSLSLYYNDDFVFNERNSILFSMTYFFVDVFDTILRGDITYLFHGTICIILGLANYNLPILRSLRMNSKAAYIEASSLVLPFAKRHRKTWLFGLFALVFTLSRIIYIPLLLKDLIDHGMEPSHPVIFFLGIFYCLNIYWYIKIIKVVKKGSGENSNKTKKETKTE